MIYDISPPISPDLVVWPGDRPAAREVLLDMARGDSVTLSSLHATVHLGAHADAPSHYSADGHGIAARRLEHYIGPCRVVRVAAGRGARVATADVEARLQVQPPDAAADARVLIATGTFTNPHFFNRDFAALEPGLIDALHRRGAVTIGIDTPSVDLFDSKDLPAHKAFLRNDMAILEGLALADVPEGIYELIALPLPLVDFDASPVRAILRTVPR